MMSVTFVFLISGQSSLNESPRINIFDELILIFFLASSFTSCEDTNDAMPSLSLRPAKIISGLYPRLSALCVR